MPWIRPTRQTLINRDAADINSRIPGFDAQLPLSMASVLAIIHGTAMDGAQGELAYMAKQVFPWSVAAPFADRYAAWNDISRKQPSPALGQAAATGSDGTTLGVGQVAQRSDGATYFVTAAVTLSGGATVSLQAQLPGSAGNTATGVTLTLQTPPNNINATLTVSGDDGLSGGTDQETTAAMMARVQLRQQQPPQGGAASDYEEWGEAQPAVTRAWCLPTWTGLGKTGLAVVNDNASPIFLSGGAIATVQAAINILRPVRGTTIVITPAEWDLNPTISLDPEDDADVQAAVSAALTDLVAQAGQVSGAVDPTTMNVFDGGFYLTDVWEAIKTAPGVIDFAISSIAGAAPVRRIVPSGNGQLARLGTITWD